MYRRLPSRQQRLQSAVLKSYLWHQPVRQGDVDDPSNKACAPQEKEVPMKATWLLEREVSCLSCDTALIL